MRTYPKRFLCTFLCCSLLLTACQSERLPTGETHQPEKEVSAADTSFPAMEQHDEAWWWQNYLCGQVYRFQQEYSLDPTGKDPYNWPYELSLLFTYAHTHGLTQPTQDSHSDVKIQKEELDRLAPIVLNKPDISHIYTGSMEDEEGYLRYYGNFSSYAALKEETSTGDWAFTVTKVEYPTPYTADVTVETDHFTRVFSYEQNRHGYYVLTQVREEPKQETTEEELVFETPLEFQVYPKSELSRELQGSITPHMPGTQQLVLCNGISGLGVYICSVHDPDALDGPPISSFQIRLGYGEIDLENLVTDTAFISCGSKFIRRYDLYTGSLLEEVPVPMSYQERMQSQICYPYVVDEELHYMAYVCEEGLFLEDLKTGASQKLTEVGSPDRYYTLKIQTLGIRDGKLYYVDDWGDTSYEHLIAYDIAGGTHTKNPLELPQHHPHMRFDRIMGDRALGRLASQLAYGAEESDPLLEIYDRRTGEQKLVAKAPEFGGVVHYTEDRVFAQDFDQMATDSDSDKLWEVDLDTGTQKAVPVFQSNLPVQEFIPLRNHILVCYGDEIVVLTLPKN